MQTESSMATSHDDSVAVIEARVRPDQGAENLEHQRVVDQVAEQLVQFQEPRTPRETLLADGRARGRNAAFLDNLPQATHLYWVQDVLQHQVAGKIKLVAVKRRETHVSTIPSQPAPHSLLDAPRRATTR